jgi:hypothetical protein
MARRKAAAGDAWLEYWLWRSAWTLRELAFLCLGWNPSDGHIRDRDRYQEAVDSIVRAVQVKALPIIETAWPVTGAEQIYDGAPMFKPRDVAPWAAEHYSTFPYRNDNAWAAAALRRNLNKLMVESGWLVGELARVTNQNRRNVEDHLSGNVRPNYETIAVYAQQFKDWLNREIPPSALTKDWPGQVSPGEPIGEIPPSKNR